MPIKNRLVRSPTGDGGMASVDGKCTDMLIGLYRELVEGGVGLIITGGAFVHRIDRSPYNIWFDNDNAINSFIGFTNEIHAYNVRLIAILLESLIFLKTRLNVNILLMSATFPPFLMNLFKKELAISDTQNVTASNKLCKQITRHKIEIIDEKYGPLGGCPRYYVVQNNHTYAINKNIPKYCSIFGLPDDCYELEFEKEFPGTFKSFSDLMPLANCAEDYFVLLSLIDQNRTDQIHHQDEFNHFKENFSSTQLNKYYKAFYQIRSQMRKDDLKKWLDDQLDQNKVEPNSGLGQAITYMLNHWKPLTTFLRVRNAPLDNNICERALKKAILHRKNSLFYKTLNGARVGDLFMSLIHTCNLNHVNPFDYLTALQKHASDLGDHPEKWMPWNYESRLSASNG